MERMPANNQANIYIGRALGAIVGLLLYFYGFRASSWQTVLVAIIVALLVGPLLYRMIQRHR